MASMAKVLPNFQFKTNVAKMDIVGDKRGVMDDPTALELVWLPTVACWSNATWSNFRLDDPYNVEPPRLVSDD